MLEIGLRFRAIQAVCNLPALEVPSPCTETKDASMSNTWAGNEDANGHIISLSVEIGVKAPLMEECVAQTVRSLRELADRIERGEEMGKIFDRDGEEIGWFDCLPEEETGDIG